MKTLIAQENKDAEALIPPAATDGSKIGVNYADAYLKALNVELSGGTRVLVKRKGLKILLQIAEKHGEGLMRRREHGPDVKVILRKALEEAACAAGSSLSVEAGGIYLEL